MKRRDFITLLATAWPLRARAQQPSLPVVGFVSGGSPGPFGYLVRALHEGLGEASYVEDKIWRSRPGGPRGKMIDCWR